MKLSLVYSYYDNLLMLTEHLRVWKTYDVQDLEIIIVDDHSDPPLWVNPDGMNIKAFRVLKKLAWNWVTCRNIGVKEAVGEWVLITDIDHVVPKETIQQVMTQLDYLDKNKVYQFSRKDVYKQELIHPHGNSLLMTREMYWKIGGYDERLSGCYFGTVRNFNRRLHKTADVVLLSYCVLDWYCLTLIPDAYTISLTKDKERDEKINKYLDKKYGKIRPAKSIKFPISSDRI